MINLRIISFAHKQQTSVKFHFYRDIFALVIIQGGALWSQILQSWYFPKANFNLNTFYQSLKGKAYIDYSKLKQNSSPTKKTATLCFLILLLSNSIFSQDLQEFNTKENLCDSCEGELFIRLKNTSFIKNNEYFNDFTEGFTGIGSFLKPTIEYYLTESTKINIGVYLLKYSGIDYFSESIPIIAIQQKLNKNLDLVFGSLYGTLNHQIKEPLFRFDRYYQKNIEYGLQLLYHSSSIESDLWINWEKFIFRNDPFQEEFESGSVTNFRILTLGRFKTYIPLQMLISHKGGQINSSQNPGISLFNGVSGLEFKYYTDKKNILSFEPLIFWYQGLGVKDTGGNSQIFKTGKGLYLNLKYESEYFNSSLGFWSSEKFIAPKGEYLFSSISEFKNTFSQVNRKLITGKLELKRKISESIKIVLRTEAYFDLHNNNLSYSYGFYFLINESILLKR